MMLKITEDDIRMDTKFLEDATEEEILEIRCIFMAVKNRQKEKQK